ncbi:MAG: universal stress protein [Planctomycetota bacterium]
MKILVPVDGSDFSEGMLAVAQRLLGDDGELLILHVLPAPPRGKAHNEREVREGGERYLEEHRQRLEKAGVTRLRWFLEEGDTAERILVISQEEQPDLVVMATHGGSPDEEHVRGSVAERVLRSAKHPLLLANPQGQWAARVSPFAKLLVPHDGSEVADAVLPHVARFAKAFGSEVVLFQVFKDSPDPRTLDRAAQALTEEGVAFTMRFAQGGPAEAILAAASEHDAVCLATHGRSGLSRWWFGSVAERVLRTCARPLLVVRPS